MALKKFYAVSSDDPNVLRYFCNDIRGIAGTGARVQIVYLPAELLSEHVRLDVFCFTADADSRRDLAIFSQMIKEESKKKVCIGIFSPKDYYFLTGINKPTFNASLWPEFETRYLQFKPDPTGIYGDLYWYILNGESSTLKRIYPTDAFSLVHAN
jgi:hypothetical protein